MPDDHEPLPSLESLQSRIDRIKPEETEGYSSENSRNDTSMAMRVGTDLVAGSLVGSVAGYLLDRWLGTMPLCLIICFFLGFAAGFRNLLRDVKKADK